VSLEAICMLAEAGMRCLWPDMHLPAGWHLNGTRVPMPVIPGSGPARHREICRRLAFLPLDLRWDPTYAIHSLVWDRWFEAEHVAWREAFEAHLENLGEEEDYWEESNEDSDVDDDASTSHCRSTAFWTGHAIVATTPSSSRCGLIGPARWRSRRRSRSRSPGR